MNSIFYGCSSLLNSYSDNTGSLNINSDSTINYKSVELEKNMTYNSIFDNNCNYKDEMNDYYENFYN